MKPSTRINLVLTLIAAIALASLVGCGGEPLDAPQSQEGATQSTSRPPMPSQPDRLTGGTWSTATVVSDAGDWHHETIRLQEDGTFTLDYVTIHGDGTTAREVTLGTWRADSTTLTLSSPSFAVDEIWDYQLTLGAQQGDAVLVMAGMTWWSGL